jgi:hypothetical protein
MPIEDKRFLFGAGALAVGGRIRRPDVDGFINSIAPTYLPITGGRSEASVDSDANNPNHRYKDFFSFTSARTRVEGDFSDPRRAAEFTHGNHCENDLSANTITETRLDGLRLNAPEDPTDNTLGRIFHAERLEGHMESTAVQTKGYPVSFHSLSANYQRISLTTVLNGSQETVGLKVITATEIFNNNETCGKLVETYANEGDFRKKFAVCFHPLGADLPGILVNLFGRHEIPRSARGCIVATFVTGLEWEGPKPPGTEILRNRLTVSGLGQIYFGEIIINEAQRSATLLRFELGSSTGGDMVAGQFDANTAHWPPGR